MKRLAFIVVLGILMAPAYRPLYGQDGAIGGGGFGGGADVSGILDGFDRGGRGGGGFNGPNNLFQVPDAKSMFTSIQSTLKEGKTPLEKSQEKPLQTLLTTEIAALNDQFQTLRNGIAQAYPAAANYVGAANSGNTPGNSQQPNPQAVQIEKLTTLKNDEFLDKKLASFLTPEQVALVQKAKAQDKNNSTCLGGLLDRASNSTGNAGRNNNYNANNNSNNNARKSNGQSYCMTAEATASERLEPVRKVLSKGKLPLPKDQEPIAEIFMIAQVKELQDALRSELSGNAGATNIAALLSSGNFNRGGAGNNPDFAALLAGISRGGNNNINPQQIVQSSVDNIYKKVGGTLTAPQAETLKRWQFEQMLNRGNAIETLIAVEALQNTPLTDEQTVKVTAAWPELRNQIQQAARAANRSVSARDIDNAAMNRILEMLEPSQVASYQLAKKYGTQAATGK